MSSTMFVRVRPERGKLAIALVDDRAKLRFLPEV